jgi:hypothetical protein
MKLVKASRLAAMYDITHRHGILHNTNHCLRLPDELIIIA